MERCRYFLHPRTGGKNSRKKLNLKDFNRQFAMENTYDWTYAGKRFKEL